MSSSLAVVMRTSPAFALTMGIQQLMQLIIEKMATATAVVAATGMSRAAPFQAKNPCLR
jgi:hypothetical protein